MFYKIGIDICSDKQMFEFIKNHFQYPTMNYWNCLYSIANNVKLYNLGLDGDWCTVLRFLESDEYDVINWMISEWEADHRGYALGFNGRSGGYIVMYNVGNYASVLPEYITENDTYEEYKQYCQEYYGSVKANRSELRYLTKLIRDFDKLCDQLRDYCNCLSTQSFEVAEMEKVIEDFNWKYRDDLMYLGFSPLTCDWEGRVDISEISALTCLRQAFLQLADRSNIGYKTVVYNDVAYYKEK